ncbi:hypothetical protein [Pseudodesulfovibrio karagichevae]|uniref:Uncharacterized protein n=1 Tax=Pseudodesulfovibrio karagichevae TaxID=3239305 RepID=A0ABV4K5Z1_9BACT
MMPIKYLCIDDAQTGIISKYTEKVVEASNGKLEIKVVKPNVFKRLLHTIQDEKAKGLIIDLRLDEIAFDEEGNTVDFRGTTLAQELRTRMGEGGFPPVPIVMWTVETNFTTSYKNIKSAQDIFDQVYEKDTAVSDHPEKVALELLELSWGYGQIWRILRGDSKAPINEILGLEEHEDWLDPRIGIELEEEPKLPDHEFANYMITNVVKPRGVLIEEEVLAARLGVSMNSKDWGALKEKICHLRYAGVFSDAWPRWWATKVEDWWFSLEASQRSLRSLKAEERVELLKKYLELEKLEASTPINESYSTKFWTICQAYHRPLDPADGYMVSSKQSLPWLEQLYVSTEALLDRTAARNNIKLHPLEREKFAEVRAEMQKAK